MFTIRKLSALQLKRPGVQVARRNEKQPYPMSYSPFFAPYTLTQSGERTMGILESRSHFLINIGLFQTNAMWSYCLNRV